MPKESNEKYCSSCGASIRKDAEICVKCGVRQAIPHEKVLNKKEPWLAALASFIIPGLGQLYNKDSFGKAALLFCTSWLILPWLYSIYDAYKRANEINSQLGIG